MTAERDFLTMFEMGERYADLFPIDGAPSGLDPVEAARYWTTERAVHGRTPMGWVEWARATYHTRLPAATPAPATDLAAAVLRLRAAVGVPAGDAAALDLAVAGVPTPLVVPLAALVDEVAAAYEREAAVAAGILARWPHGFSMTTPLASPEERDAMAANGAAVLDALKAFHARAAPLFGTLPVNADPLFIDPAGLVVLGGLGNNAYEPTSLVADAPPVVVDLSAASLPPVTVDPPAQSVRLNGEPVLVVEPGGNDVYRIAAGAACPDPAHLAHQCNGLALSAVYDVSGDDAYAYDGPAGVAQGAGSFGGVGLLVDVAGEDNYSARLVRTTRSAIFQYIDGGAQGFSEAGFGLLLDGTGNDARHLQVHSTQGRSIWAFGQGYGAAGSIGLALDELGNDRWTGGASGPHSGSGGFQGAYTHGTGFWGGVGLLLDLGLGADVYRNYLEAQTVDYYAEGFGAFGGLGIQFEDGGADDYYAVEKAHNPFINPLLNCAFGTGSLGGVGVFIDVSGNDRYYGDTITPLKAATMNEGFGGIGAAVGVHVDLEGDDDRVMYASGAPGSFVAGRGHAVTNGNIIGTYLDAGGTDRYVGPGHNNGVWAAGADQEIVPGSVL